MYLGAKVVMAVKDVHKASNLKDKILKDIPNGSIFIEFVDFFDLDSIKKVAPILKEYSPNYLINNAGVYHLPPLKNKEGIERTFCVNFYGQYLLTNEI